MLLTNILVWLLSHSFSFGQSIPVSLFWDKEVGCQVYNNDGNHKTYEEHIASGTCLQEAEFTEVTFTISGSNSSWTNTIWNVIGGTIVGTPTNTNCTISLGANGAGAIGANINTTNGVINLQPLSICKLSKPTAQFYVTSYSNTNSITVCKDQNLYFNNISIPNNGAPIVSQTWDFGDGTTSSSLNPNHAYNTFSPTPYIVKLTVYNSCNCFSEYEYEIYVKSTGFDIACESVVCEGQTAVYTIPPSANVSCSQNFNWSVTGGTIISPQPYGPSIQVNWDNLGLSDNFGYVSFDPSACVVECPTITTVKIPVIKNKAEIIGETQVCLKNLQYIYRLPQWPGTDFVWSLQDPDATGATLLFSDQKNETILQTAGGYGNIVLTATYINRFLKCGGTANLPISILQKNGILGKKNVCLDDTAVYTLINPVMGNWIMTSPSGQVYSANAAMFTNNFSEVGNYILTNSNQSFCGIEPLVIVVSDKPFAPIATNVTGQGLSAQDTMCPGFPMVYTYNNTDPNTTIGWSITGGIITSSNYGNTINVVFNPSAPSFSLTIWQENVQSPNCKSNLVTIPIFVPDVNFPIAGDTPVCSSNTGNYSFPYAGAESYQWTIIPPTAGSVVSGNGTPNVVVLWNLVTSPVNRTLRLTLKKCSSTFIKNKIVQVVPTFVTTINPINPNPVCSGASVTPTLSINPTTYSDIFWDFGDGSPLVSGTLIPSYIYNNTTNANINYTISVKIVQPNGCLTNTLAIANITVYPKPEGNITPPGNYNYCTVADIVAANLTLTASIQSGTSLQWYNGISPITGATGVSHTVSDFGNYYIRITNNTTGCFNDSNKVYINEFCLPLQNCTFISTPTTILTRLTDTSCIKVINVKATYTTANFLGIMWLSNGSNSAVTTSTTTSGGITTVYRSFTYNLPGEYDIYYKVDYNSTTNTSCPIVKTINVIVPYKADLKYAITCGNNGIYNVILKDNSTFYAQTIPAIWKFYKIVNSGSPILISTQTTQAFPNQYSFTLTPGTYSFMIVLSKPGFNDCSFTTDTVILPDMPSAAFTWTQLCGSCVEVCTNKPIQFTVTNPQPDNTYYWDFGDFSYNVQQNPGKVYAIQSNPSGYEVKLVVTNKYGCSTSSIIQYIKVIQNQLGGKIEPAELTACNGSPITFTFTNLGLIPPTSFQWMKDTQPIPGATSNTYTVSQPSQSGLYWVKIANSNGCTLDVNGAVKATIIATPNVYILGPNAICGGGQTINLYSNVVSNNSNQFLWSMNGAPIGVYSTTTPTFSTILTNPGTYTFTLNVRIPNPNGFCQATVATKTVVVTPPPANPVITIIDFDCAKYSIKLHAEASEPGTFVWSNGMSGPDITVTIGGVYQVRFISDNGCSSLAEIMVPKNPESFLWVVPKGCYDFCRVLNNPTLTAANGVEFQSWSWLNNGTAVMSGIQTQVQAYIIANSGNYSLSLNNGYCTATSTPMSVNVTECAKCNLFAEVSSITPIQGKYCHYEIKIFIDNVVGYPLSVTITSNTSAIVVPTTVLVPVNGATFYLDYIPTGIAGGPATLIFEAIFKDGKKCKDQLNIFLPNCILGKDKQDAGNDNPKFDNFLTISPNPTKAEAILTYKLENEMSVGDYSIFVYDLTGKEVQHFTSTKNSGSWTINLQDYPSGQYVVVLKNNEVIVDQKKLIKN